MDLFGAAHPSLNLSHISYNDETWHSYTLIKEYPEIIQITWHTSCVLLTSAFLHRKSATFVISRDTDIDCISICNSDSFSFFWVFKACLINKVAILIMSAKLALLGLLKIKVFWNKVYQVIISAHDITKKFSKDSSFIVDVVMWSMFGNSSVTMREVIITSIL